MHTSTTVAACSLCSCSQSSSCWAGRGWQAQRGTATATATGAAFLSLPLPLSHLSLDSSLSASPLKPIPAFRPKMLSLARRSIVSKSSTAFARSLSVSAARYAGGKVTIIQGEGAKVRWVGVLVRVSDLATQKVDSPSSYACNRSVPSLQILSRLLVWKGELALALEPTSEAWAPSSERALNTTRPTDSNCSPR